MPLVFDLPAAHPSQFRTPIDRTRIVKFPRWARVLLAFFLVPVVVFINPTHASAASGWTEVDVALGGDADCWMSFSGSGSSLNVGQGSFCTGGPDYSPGMGQPGEAGGSYAIAVFGTTSNGTACGGEASGTLGSHPSNGTVSTAGTIGTSALSVGATDCTVTQVCVVLEGRDSVLGDGRRVEGCQGTSIPPAPAPLAACPAGTPHAYVSVESVPHPSVPSIIRDNVYVNVAVAGNTLGTARQWGFRLNFPGTNYESGVVDEASKTLITTVSRSAGDPVLNPVTNGGLQLYAYIPEPAGVDIYWNTAPVDARVRNTPTTFPMTAGSPFFGVTDGAQCRWYYGVKRFDDPTSVKDDPFGPLDNPTPPETGPGDPPPPPDIPSPDEGTDWLALIWALLKGILNVLGGLASAIANAIIGALSGLVDLILDGLHDLFVPDEGFMDDSFSDVQADWEDTSLTKWMDAAEGITAGSSAGCGGLPLNVTLPGGVQVSENVGAACSGSMATASGIVRMVLSAGLVVTGAFACLRGIGAGFNWSPSVGRGES